MDTIDRSNSNLPAQFHMPLSNYSPGLTPALPPEQGGAPAVQINSRVIVRGLIRHWWRILALWLVVSAPTFFLIYFFIQPTYEAASLLRIEPAQPEIFGSLRDRDGGGTKDATYLQTQVRLITSEKVLNPAVADALVVHLPTIKKSEDPKSDLRKALEVEIVKDTNLIRVALELPNPDEAVTIVKSVVQSYLSQNTDYSRSANRELTDSLIKQLAILKDQIDAKKEQLRKLVKNATIAVLKPQDMLNTKTDADSTQPTFRTLSESHVEQMMAEMLRTELELLEAQSMLDTKIAANQPNQLETEQQPQVDEKELSARIEEQFHKDPDVQALVGDIEELHEQLEHTKKLARQRNEPARLAVQEQVDKMENKYKKLWNTKYKEIRQRLNGTSSESKAPEAIEELKLKVAALTKKKERQAEHFKLMQVEQKKTNDDTFEATYLNYQVSSLMNWEEVVKKNLEQLKFEAGQDKYRVVLVDPAAASKIPSNNKRLKYMAAAPVGVMFMMLGLFLLLEIKAERVADPDSLATRVRSEVYALPPLPTGRSIRKLSVSDADNQIEQFIQRLDHLRFAVCGTPAQVGKGRCVLITSAIGGEGKTTLAAQLAARCGNSGMSTLLIDSDFRRASLCPLLDVPEGPGLSDLLKDEATIDEVTIPVQGGTFYLLPAGMPIQDTSRVLQSPKFGHLISELRQLYDLIIIDSPPVLPVPDALILGRWADGAVIAARYDISRFPQVERARRQLDNAGIAVLGTVINGMRHSDSYYGRYTYSRRRADQSDSSNAI
jgi:polysaccharide biosynthesis transport protein